MQLIEITSIDEFRELRHDWNSLMADSSSESIFLTHEWLMAWMTHFKKDQLIDILILLDGSRFIAAAPLMIKKGTLRGLPVKELSFIENDETGRSDFIIRHGSDEKEIIDVLFRHIIYSKNLRWDIVDLRNIPSDSITMELIEEFLRTNHILFGKKKGLSSPYITIDQSWPGFIRNRRHFRKKMKDRLNRIQREGRTSITHIIDFKRFVEYLSKIEKISKNSWLRQKSNDIFGTEERKGFFIDLARRASEEGWLSVWVLELNGEAIAFEFHLRHRNSIHALRASYNREYSKVSPGFVLECKIVESCFKENVSLPVHYDLCGGVNFYKERWTKDIQNHMNILVFKSNLLGRLLYYMEIILITRLKKIINKGIGIFATQHSGGEKQAGLMIDKKTSESAVPRDEVEHRLIADYGMSHEEAELISSSKSISDYFRICCDTTSDGKLSANWIANELLFELKKTGKDFDNCPVSPKNLGSLINMLKEGRITGKSAKIVFKEMFSSGDDPVCIVADKGLDQTIDEEQVQEIVSEVVNKYPDQIRQYKEGNAKVFNFFVGNVMKITEGKADPEIVKNILKEKLVG